MNASIDAMRAEVAAVKAAFVSGNALVNEAEAVLGEVTNLTSELASSRKDFEAVVSARTVVTPVAQAAA